MIEIRELAPPPDVKEREQKAAERVKRLRKEGLLRLSSGQLAALEKIVDKRLRISRKETEPLRRRLTRWNDNLEGIVDETNFPFEGASNITLRYAMGLARTFESKFNRTLYAEEDIFTPDFDPGVKEELQLSDQAIKVLQEGFNHSFAKEFNGFRVLKSGTIPVFRDGTFLIEGSWERRVERVFDQRTYTDIVGFQKDYPDAKTAGGSEEDYQAILDFFLVEGEEAELIVKFDHDMVTFEGPEYRQILRAKFLIYPTIAKTIKEATMYGCGFELTKEEVRSRAKRGEYYKDQVSKGLAKRSADTWADDWDRSRLFTEGHAAPEPDNAPVRLYDLIVSWDRDNDDIPERYRVFAINDGDKCTVISCRPYDIRHNVPTIVPFRIAARDYSFEGYSMVGDGEDLFNQVDVLFRHDNNVMMLTTSPMFLANEDLKDKIDFGRAEMIIRPGVTYWVPDISKAIMQLPVQDLRAGAGDNDGKLAIISRFLELLTGVSQGLSGQESQDDPRAPARKTTLLLMTSGQRIDQGIEEWCESLPDLGRLHATLLYQYSGKDVYNFQGKKGDAQSFPIKILGDERIRWLGKRRSVALTPEYSMGRLQGLMQVYTGLRPLLMQGDQIATETWNRMVKTSGEPQSEKLMMDESKSPELQAQATEKAMQAAMQDAKMKAVAQGQKTFASEVAKRTVDLLADGSATDMSGATKLNAEAKQFESMTTKGA